MKNVLDHTGKLYAKYFEEISSIPRPSFHEEAIADYIVAFAKERDLFCYRDKHNNILIRKKATPGYENHETVLLQGHLDMIQTKTPESTFDFNNPLELIVENGFLKANGTTCGSDDGVAIAYMLAVLDECEKHPELECVFTAAEEAGLAGAMAFDYSLIHARKYISMDCNTEGTNLVISAGGINSEFIRTYKKEMISNACLLDVAISGLTGGHASIMINRERANALKMVGRILLNLRKKIKFRLTELNGGDMTTIANWANVKMTIAPEDCNDAITIIKTVFHDIRGEHEQSDPNMKLEINTSNGSFMSLDENMTNDTVNLLYLAPHGLQISSLEFEGVPLVSCALDQCTMTENELRLRIRPRSAFTAKLQDIEDHCRLLSEICHYNYIVHFKCLGHHIPLSSPLYNVYNEVWKELTGREVIPIAAHFSNEIGTFLQNVPDLDVITMVATHYDAHTPYERLDLESFDRCYKCLVRILERI